MHMDFKENHTLLDKFNMRLSSLTVPTNILTAVTVEPLQHH